MGLKVQLKYDDGVISAAADADPGPGDALNRYFLGHTVEYRTRTGRAGAVCTCLVDFEDNISEPALGGLITALQAVTGFSDVEQV